MYRTVNKKIGCMTPNFFVSSCLLVPNKPEEDDNQQDQQQQAAVVIKASVSAVSNSQMAYLLQVLQFIYMSCDRRLIGQIS